MRNTKTLNWLVACAYAAVLVFFWIWIELLDHDTRDMLLWWIGMPQLIIPFLYFSPSLRLGWYAFYFSVWAFVLCIRYIGDMGPKGHFSAAGMAFLCLWSVLWGLGILPGRKPARRRDNGESQIEDNPFPLKNHLE